MTQLPMFIKKPTKKLVGEIFSIFAKKRFRKIAWDIQRERKASKDFYSCLKMLLSSEFEFSESTVNSYLEHVLNSGFLEESIDEYRSLVGIAFPEKLEGKALSTILFCHVLIRIVKPEIVVETGCASGWTSALILEALKENGRGHLYSIDLPPEHGRFSMPYSLPSGVGQGFLVPESLRSRWNLISGDVRDELIPLLDRVEKVDLFLHDSDHSYEHMMWEYTSVWPYLSDSGVIVSDDIGWNCSFLDFSNEVMARMAIHHSNPNVGAISRP
jgi:predicted O-methyltransferase YrrM